MMIHTYGGVDLLQKVFESISAVLYAGPFNGLMKLTLLVGGFCCICLAFFRQTFVPLVQNFLLPGVCIASFVLIPRSHVVIRDERMEQSVVVERVPFCIGTFAALVSEGIYQLERLFPRPVTSWLRHLEQNDHPLFRSHFQDPVLKENLREYCRECVFRDLGIGLYTQEQLEAAPDLLQFLHSKSSNLRTMLYREATDRSILSCREAMIRMMRELWAETPEGKQRVAIELLRSSHRTSNGIVVVLLSVHHFFEAMLYLLLPLVLLLSLVSFGIRILLYWLKLVLWVAIWPLCYVAIDLFLDVLWNMRTRGLDLSLLGSVRKIDEAMQCIEASAWIALILLPILCAMLLRIGKIE
jgi:hypothetical protein